MRKIAFDLIARLKLNDEFSSKMRKVTDEMGKAERATSRMTSGVSNFTKQVGGIAAAIGITAGVAKGFDMIRNSIDGAISRYDTMNNFPRVMEQVGFSMEESRRAIDRLSEGIDGLPTTLDDVTASAQRIAVMTGDLDGAVETSLALNNAFLASGSNAMDASRGFQQYVQMLAKGEVDLQSWRTLQETMGLALNDVAKAFGYTGKSAQSDLFDALKHGQITFDEFNEKVIELSNAQGGFAERALTASGGIRTAWTNMKTAVVRNVANMIGEIDKALGGTGSIEDIIMKIRKGIDTAFKAVTATIVPVANAFKRIYKALEPWHPLIKQIGVGLLTAVGALAGFMAFVGTFKAIGAAIAFLTSPVGLVVLGITAIVVAFQQAYEKSERFREGVHKVISGVKAFFKSLKGESGSGADFLAVGFSFDQIVKIQSFVNKLRDTFTKAKGFIKGFFKSLRGESGSGSDFLAAGFSFDQVVKIQDFINGIKEKVSEFVTYLKGKWAEIKPGVMELVDNFLSLKDTAIDIFTSIWNAVQPVFASIGSAFQIVADIAVMVFQNVIVPVVNHVITMFQLMWKILGPVLELVGAAIGAAFEILKVVWDTIIKPVAGYLLGEFKNALESSKPILDVLGSAFDWLGDKISGAAKWLRDVAGLFRSIKVPDWVGKLGGRVANFFAGGPGGTGAAPTRNYHGIDYVPKDGTRTILHKGEAVLTAQENKARQQGGGGVTIAKIADSIVIREEADIDRLMDAMVRKIEDAGGAGA